MAYNSKTYVPGQQVGLVIFIKEVAPRYYSGQIQRFATFECKCGKLFDCGINRVVYEKTKSCGCLNIEAIIKRSTVHGKSRVNGKITPEYKTWKEMKFRCNTKKGRAYEDYGKRGIVVCERWANSYQSFLDDMGKRPSPKHSIDRYPNNNGNYELGNCRWATAIEQSRNKRTNIFIEYLGETKCMSEWAKKLKIKLGTLYGRLESGWSVEKAFNTPVRNLKKRVEASSSL